MSANGEKRAAPKRQTWDPSGGVQWLLLLDMWVRSMIWSMAMMATLVLLAPRDYFRALSWDVLTTWGGAWQFGNVVMWLVLFFNIFYVLTLIIVRLPIPTPRRGVHRLSGVPSRDLIAASLLGVLTKARYYPPFPGIFVSQLANMLPFRWLLGLQFGPCTQTSFFLDPLLVDPWSVSIGKNVTIGLGAMITGHLHEHDFVLIDHVRLDDDITVGAYAGIGCGTHVKSGAMLEPYAVVKPGLVVGEGEFWGGSITAARFLRPVRNEPRSAAPSAAPAPST